MKVDQMGMHRTRSGPKRPALLVAAVVGAGALALAGCSSSSTTSAVPRPSKTTKGSTAAPSSRQTTPSKSTTTAPTPTTSPRASNPALAGDLLTVSELPAGWTSTGTHTENSSSTNLPSTAPSCLKTVEGIQSKYVSLVATFKDSSSGLELEESLLQAGSASSAASAYKQFTTALSACGSSSTPSNDVISVSPLSVPTVSQPSTAFHVAITAKDGGAISDAVLGPRGSLLWVVALSGSSQLSITTLSTITNAALAKIPS
jgi:hypothetical protein